VLKNEIRVRCKLSLLECQRQSDFRLIPAV
jgi:hypothetical protein